MIATATASHTPAFSSSRTERPNEQHMVGMNGRSLSGGGGGGGGSYGGDSTTTSTNTTNGYRSSGGSLGDGNGAPLERTRSGDISTDDESGANRSSESRIPSRMYVRALYNYSTEDETSLSFNSGDVIQVLKQLDSGWWDGIVHGQRGWFPSNYCQVLNSNDYQNGGGSALDDSDDLDEDDSYDEYDDDDEEDDENDLASPGLPLEGTDADNKDDEAAFWIPQATPDGRLYYFNTNTGVYRSELPLDTPGNMNETGPRDRQNVGIPESTKPPVEMLANGYEREEREYPHHGEGDSESEREGMNGMNGMNGHQHRSSEATLVDSFSTVPDGRSFRPGHSQSFSISTEATVVNTPSIYTNGSARQQPPQYYEDNIPVPQSWDELIQRTEQAVNRYRRAVNTFDRANYVRRAEDISDMLRLLITAGSTTTDNHSGQPSIISSNRTLNPHFRHFMAAFSKLVLSSHVATTEHRPADAEVKCLAEADEVMVGVHGFAETAKAQRGDQLPRLKPGFIVGSHAGAGWRGIMAPVDSQTDELGHSQPNGMVALNSDLTDNMEELNTSIKNTMKHLDATLAPPGRFITAQEQAFMGHDVIEAAMSTFDAVQRYFNLIENINMGVTNAHQSPTLMDFVVQKQRLHDSVADLMMACQSITAPLADEWTTVRGESMAERLTAIRQYIREVESGVRSLNFSAQLLVGERESQEELAEEDLTDAQWNGRGHAARPSQHTISTTNSVPSKVKKLLGETPTPVPVVEKPKYLMCDYDHEILYGAKGQVKGGTLVALVERLTRHDNLDPGYNTTFLLTYPTFTTSQELFSQLVARFTIQPPPALSPIEFDQWVEQKQKLIRMRVLSILKMWLESNWMEQNDTASKDLLRKMYTFAREVMLPQLIGTQQVISLIETRMKGQEPENKRLVPAINAQIPAPILPRSMRRLKFLDIDPTEFARQLTIIEYRSYSKLKASECLSKGAWGKVLVPGEIDKAENIRQIILQSNQLTNWVAEMILKQNEVRKRVLVIKHFVNIAEKCRSLNNFSTLTSILAAIQTSAIHRLRRTWDTVPQRTQQQLLHLNNLMSASMNFANYRETLHLVNPPCVPFLGVYLKDLTFVADGNDDYIKDTELINYGKRVKTSNIIQEIQQYQAVPYQLQPVQELLDFVVTSMRNARDCNEMYGVSLLLEPREREDEKIARLLQESGFL